MLHLLVDTCVWLDTAKDPRGERLIASVRVLVAHEKIRLLVPAIVIDEYGRNREHVVSSLATSMRAHLRTARALLANQAPPNLSEQLVEEFGNAASRGPLVHEFVVGRFGEVNDLLNAGHRVEPNEQCLQRVVQRALDRRAPFHRAKNSVADAMLAEMFRQTWTQQTPSSGDRFAFVTHNAKDFSDGGDHRKPHPDLADCLVAPLVGYYTSLESALVSELEGASDLIEECDLEEEPRSGQEILAAEKQMCDLIWYQHSLGSMSPLGESGRQRVESLYSPEELRPYNDFEWGMLHGKLSALRWVMGDEWDFLDT